MERVERVICTFLIAIGLYVGGCDAFSSTSVVLFRTQVRCWGDEIPGYADENAGNECFQAYVRGVSRALANDIFVAVAIEERNCGQETLASLSEAFQPAAVFAYNARELLRYEFPVLAAAWADRPAPWEASATKTAEKNEEDNALKTNLDSYRIHEPSVTHWYKNIMPRQVEARGGDASAITGVWVIRDDAVFLGDIAAFVRKYERMDANAVLTGHKSTDLLTIVNGNFRKKIDTALHPGTYEKLFSWQLGVGHYVLSWEHVVRYSAELIDFVDKLSRIGAYANGHLYSATVCSLSSWCTLREIRKEDIWQNPWANSAARGGDGPPAVAVAASEGVRERWMHGLEWVKDDSRVKCRAEVERLSTAENVYTFLGFQPPLAPLNQAQGRRPGEAEQRSIETHGRQSDFVRMLP